MSNHTTEKILKNFFQLHWVRPEVAIWRTLDALQMKSIRFRSPSLDIGCGDGTFIFTNLGGMIETNFDVYKTMAETSGFHKKRDIYDQPTRVQPKIIKKTSQKIDVGIDWKQNLLDKANHLKVYQKLIQHNVNTPLPFHNNSFNIIFSNIFYWIDNIELILKESNRVCRDDGKIVLVLPDERFKKMLVYNQFLKHNYTWAKILDRGIYANVSKHCYTLNKWKTIFSKTGLRIKIHSNYLSENLVKFWNIGTRPYSPYLIEMANKLKENERNAIKRRVLRDLFPVLKSFLNHEIELIGKQGCFHMFVLERNY